MDQTSIISKLELSREWLLSEQEPTQDHRSKISKIEDLFLQTTQQRRELSIAAQSRRNNSQSLLSIIYVECGPVIFLLCCIAFPITQLARMNSNQTQVVQCLKEWMSSVETTRHDLLKSLFSSSCATVLSKLVETSEAKSIF
ncbi:hypothetical protein V2G26_007760 [Clonostachys chloroleuca]